MGDYTWAKIHAALNDLPAALLLVAVLFDLGGWLLKRETIRATGLWTLWAGVVGGWAAYLAGQRAEESIDHGEAIHEIMERHEDLALYTMIAFTLVLLWKLWRRGGLRPLEEWGLRALSLVGLALLVATGAAGGRAVFEHAAGVTDAHLVEELKDRGVAFPADTTAKPDSGAGSAGHVHAPGTKAHTH